MAKANVAIHRARLERARVDARDAEAQRAVLQARLDNARARYANAVKAFDRSTTLQERGTVAAAQLEDVEAEREQTAALVREAEAILAAHENAVEGAGVDIERAEAELANALAAVPQQQAVVRSAEIDLERTTIRSPIDGVVVGRNVDEGQTVAASLEAPTLFTIAGDLGEMEIHARVDEADIGKMVVGQRAVFRVDAYPERLFDAVVTGLRKAPEVVQNVVTYTVVLATSNPDSLLLPGMTATVRITVHEDEAVLKLPLAALRFAPSGNAPAPEQPAAPPDAGRPATVWTLSADGALRPVTVGIGADDGAQAAILSPGPLAEGASVVIGEVVERAPDRLFGIRFGF
jgi:HlyD family secretion protein